MTQYVFNHHPCTINLIVHSNYRPFEILSTSEITINIDHEERYATGTNSEINCTIDNPYELYIYLRKLYHKSMTQGFCPNCEKEFQYKDLTSLGRVKCPHCGHKEQLEG